MKTNHPLFLSLLSGILLFAAWPVSPFTFIIFIAFVPLLILARQNRRRLVFFGWTYLTLLIWNACTTWWTCNSTLPGGIAAILANSLLMCVPWLGYYNIKKRMGERVGYIALVVFWMSFEYIHLNWELSWPWLTLGNVFAGHPNWIQWYEFTGTSGGTLWVLLVNIIAFQLWQKKSSYTSFPKRQLILFMVLIIVPAASSYLLIPFDSDTDKAGYANIVIVQPNVDPWDEKFMAGKEEGQLQKLIHLSQSQIDAHTALVVWPETAIPVDINEDSIRNNYFIAGVWDFLKAHPGLNLLTGMEGFRIYDAGHKTRSSIKIPNSTRYADSYNSAVLMDSDHFIVYHKSRLVPGAETMPSFLHFMDSWFEKFGGTSGGYAGQEERTVLQTYNHSFAIAPSVCYESIYGEFMAKYVRNGANLIVIITNDGWWGNTAGYKQHESYARLRAIETRRWVARSANTGISCFITPSGEVIDPQPWDKATAIKMNVPLAGRPLTFFVKHGDLLSKLAMILGLAVLCWNIVFLFTKKRNNG